MWYSNPAARGLLSTLIIAVCGVTGCVDVEQLESEQQRRAAPPPKRFVIEQLNDADLPGTERTMGPLDGEHLVVPIPDGWYVPPRDSRWLMRMQFVRAQPYPTIIINGGENTDVDAQDRPIKQLGKSNIEAYAKRLQDQLDTDFFADLRKLRQELADAGGQDAAIEAKIAAEQDRLKQATRPEVEAIMLDRFYAVTYVQPAIAQGKMLDRLMIITIERGRKYEVELRALRGTLRRFRPEAYAVAARLKVF